MQTYSVIIKRHVKAKLERVLVSASNKKEVNQCLAGLGFSPSHVLSIQLIEGE